MKNIKHLIYTVALCCSAMALGQQEAQYTQYMYNTMAINPAYAGSRAQANINLLYRSQWSGLDGAPSTQTLNLSVPTSERVSVGLSVLNDEIGNGTNQETEFGGVFSYTIPLEYYGRLSFGLKAGGNILNVDYNNLRNLGLGVPADLANVDRKFSPNFGIGAFYNSQQFYAGLSIPNILETNHFDNNAEDGSFVAKERMHFYFVTGYVFEMNPRALFKPAALVRTTPGSPAVVDVSANFLFAEKFRIGASYRLGAAVSGLFGLDVSPQMMIGLAYDRETTELGKIVSNGGSLEVFLRYRFKANKRYVSPLFF